MDTANGDDVQMVRLPKTLLLIALVIQCCTHASAQLLSVVHRSTVTLPSATTDQNGEGFGIAGLSGIAYAGPSPSLGLHRFVAAMDNSSKLVTLDIAVAGNGSLSNVTVVAGFTLAQAADFEDIVIRDGGTRILLSEENTPAVRVFDALSGSLTDTLPTPPVFFDRRDNFGFEALAASGSSLWTANEEALTVDGPTATQSTGTLVRLLRLDRVDGLTQPGPQFAYRCEPLHGSPVSGARSGLVAINVLPNGRMLALERSFAFNLGGFFRSRLFEVDLAGASDVSSLASLVAAAYSPAGKVLLWSGNLNNLEGLCVGPALPGGGRILVGVVDDGDPVSASAVVSFQLIGPTEAQCLADADMSGDVGVPDIFVYLSWWFASDVRADVDGVSGVAVPDIFAFLSAWFAGCSR